MTIALKLSLSALAVSLVTSVATAKDPSAKEWAHARVTHALVKPLQKHEAERPRVSRVSQPAKERRVRIVQTNTTLDRQGRSFLGYTIEARRGERWEAEFTGCVYRKTGSIFVKRGDEYRPAEFLFGKRVDPVAGVCEAGRQA